MANNILQSNRAETVNAIIACRNQALDKNHTEINRLNARISELNNKVFGGGVLTDAEEKEQQGLLAGIDELVALETQVILFSLSALDSAPEAKYLASQVENANKELEDVKKKVESISKAIKNAGDFLNGLAGVLNSLTGLLKLLA
jgi:hypothetical protein